MTDTNQLNWQRTNLENIETAWEGDLWDRKRLGIQLTKYVDRLQCGAVLALDARWGEGKTWFVRHWQKHLEDENHNVIYLDAFANDYLDDPFLTIAAEISQAFKSSDNIDDADVNSFNEKTASVLISLAAILPVIAAKAGLHWIGLGGAGEALQEVYKDGKDVYDSVSDEITGKLKEHIEKKIENHHLEKETIQDFKKELNQLADKLEKPLVFIIDELDRCRPDFAIRLIERIKHFFDIPKIVFVLVMDKTQFSKVVCHNYGYDEKLGEEYLDKFVDFTVGLNTLTPKLQDNLKINIYDVFEKLGLDFSDAKFECCVDLIAFYVKDQSLSKRSIIKLASQFALLYSEKFDKYKNQILIILLVNKSFLLTSNDSLELYKVLLNQMDDYIAKNESDFSKFKALYAQSNYSTILIKAFFFYEENNISVFSELVDNFEQLNSSQKRLSIVSMRNLRPTENTDFLGSWKNYIFGGI